VARLRELARTSEFETPGWGQGHLSAVRSGRILLIDPCVITCESLAHALHAYAADVEVQCLFDEATCTTDTYDLILLNIHGSKVAEPAVQDRITNLRREYGASQPIAVIGDPNKWELVIQVIHRHALRGYLPTTLTPSVAAAALRLVLAGGIFAPAEPGAEISSPQNDEPEACRLTYREADVLRLLRLGKPNKIIAFDLGISESTVKVHVRNIMKKLHATNRTQVALLQAGSAARSMERETEPSPT